MFRNHRRSGGLTTLALAGTLLALTACGAGDRADATDAVTRLSTQVQEQKRLNDALLDRIGRLERRVDGHTQDLDRLSRQRVAAGLASAEVARSGDGDSASATAAPLELSPEAVATLLETEDGQAAVERAMQAIQERRDAERRERWASAMVDRFAQEANLTQPQTEDVRRIVADSFQRIGDLWSGMRDASTSDAERAIQREEAMLKMEEIRQETNDEMKAVLSSDQYAIYEEMSNRMRGWGGGGRGRGR